MIFTCPRGSNRYLINLVNIIMIGKCLSFSYRIRKPRVFSENDLSLIRYKKELKGARRTILVEAIRHAHEYEDMFLENRKQLMLEKHRKN